MAKSNGLITNNRAPEFGDPEKDPDMFCGCGRRTRYAKSVTIDGQISFVHSCNKYHRCPTYNQLATKLQKAEMLIDAYRALRKVDGRNGRPFVKADHFRAESDIERREEEFAKNASSGNVE